MARISGIAFGINSTVTVLCVNIFNDKQVVGSVLALHGTGVFYFDALFGK